MNSNTQYLKLRRARGLKVGDKVKIISGSERGKVSGIISFYKDAAFVKGCNIKHRYISKLSPEEKRNVTIERVSESPIALCKLMLCDDKGNASKVKWVFRDGKKIRTLKKSGDKI